MTPHKTHTKHNRIKIRDISATIESVSFAMDSDKDSVLAIGGLLLAKSVLLLLMVLLCCKRPSSRREDAASEAVDTEASSEAAKEKAVKGDVPPSYSFIMKDEKPPPYLDSVLNAAINPVVNRGWADDLDLKRVDPEVAEVVERSRTNSLVPGQSEGQSVRSNRRRSEITMDPRAVAASVPGIFVIEF